MEDEKNGTEEEKRRNLTVKSIVKVFFVMTVFAAVLFISAGRLDWVAGGYS